MEGLSKSAKKNAKRAAKKKNAVKSVDTSQPCNQQAHPSHRVAHTCIVWFRDDLRLTDNPALFTAAQKGSVVPVFIRDDEGSRWPVCGAAAIWLHHSLLSLESSLAACGARLISRHGEALSILLDLITSTGATEVHFNNVYEPWQLRRDDDVEAILTHPISLPLTLTIMEAILVANGIAVHRHKANVLYEPWEANPDAEPGSLHPIPIPKPCRTMCQTIRS